MSTWKSNPKVDDVNPIVTIRVTQIDITSETLIRTREEEE